MSTQFSSNNPKMPDPRGRTLLCLGPMSLNTFKAICECSRNSSVPLFIIASRNQIEAEKFGGGYVNNWTTESFLEEIKKSGANIIPARDHGGPFQSEKEKNDFGNPKEAFDNSLKSLEVDITHGFRYLHLDPSKYNKNVTIDGMITCLTEMYGHCDDFAKKNGKEVFFEIGSEGHGTEVDNVQELEYFLSNVMSFIQKHKLTKPTFCVAKLGSYVKESANIGTFVENIKKNSTEDIKKIVNLIHRYKLKLKQHNADYLPLEIVKEIPALKIDSINIAPELGTIESKAILGFLDQHNLIELKNNFIDLVKKSGTWKKWAAGSELSDEKICQIAGHYVYAYPEFEKLKDEIAQKDPSLDQVILKQLQNYINENLKALNISSV